MHDAHQNWIGLLLSTGFAQHTKVILFVSHTKSLSELFPANHGKKRKKSVVHLNDSSKKFKRNSEENNVGKSKFKEGKTLTGNPMPGKGNFKNKVQNKHDKKMKNKGSFSGRERKTFIGHKKNKT